MRAVAFFRCLYSFFIFFLVIIIIIIIIITLLLLLDGIRFQRGLSRPWYTSPSQLCFSTSLSNL